MVFIVTIALLISLVCFIAGISFFMDGEFGLSTVLVLIGFVVMSCAIYTQEGDYNMRNGTAYMAYFAYEDGDLSDDELKVFSEYTDTKELARNMNREDVSDEYYAFYEGLVNKIIDEADSSEEKLKFKKYVLIRDQERLEDMFLDNELDVRERELIEFAGDVLSMSDREVDEVIEDLEADEEKVDLTSLNSMISKLDILYVGFKLSEVYESSNDDSDTGGFYKVDKNRN